MFRGFIFINFLVYLFVCVFIGVFDPMGNWVESMEREDFMEMKKNFNIFIFITPQYCWGVEFIIKKSLLE